MNQTQELKGVVVEQVAASLKGVKVAGHGWINKGKGAKFASFAGINVGDKLDLEVTDSAGKLWATSMSLVGIGDTGQTQTKTASAPMSTGNSSIARQAAFKAVLGSPLVAALLKDKPEDQAIGTAKTLIEQMTNYALTGKFAPEV